MLADQQAGTLTDPSKITLGEWLDRWMVDYMKQSLRWSTWSSYETQIRVHIKPALEHVPLAKLKTSDLQVFYNGKKSGGLASRTVRYFHQIINSALKQALAERMILYNPCDAAKLPKLDAKGAELLTEDELQLFLTSIKDSRLRAAFLFEIGTGVRRGELLALAWQDVDLKLGTAYIRRSLNRFQKEDGGSELRFHAVKTAGSERTVPLPGFVIVALGKHKIRQEAEKLKHAFIYQDKDLVFCTELGKPLEPRNFIRHYALLLERAGIAHTRFHNIRHTVATMLLKQNEHPKVVQELLGHASVITTLNTYSHVVPGLKEKAASTLDAALKKIMKSG